MNLLRQIFFILALVSFAQAQSSQTFEIRTAPPMAGRNLNVVDPNGSGYSVGSFSLSQAGSWSGDVWSGETHAVLSGVQFSLDENYPEQVWTFEAGGRTAQITYAELQSAVQGGVSGSNGFVLPVDFTSASGIAEFLVGTFYEWDPFLGSFSPTTHALSLVQPGAPGQPSVVTPLSINDQFTGNTIEGEAFTWSHGSATYDPAREFYVVDLTTGQRTAANVTHLGLAQWSADTTTSYPLKSVTFFLSPENWGYSFTLHYQAPGRPEMMQALTAEPTGMSGMQTMGYGGSVDATGSVGFTGSVAVGSYYWITRDADGWDSHYDSAPLPGQPPYMSGHYLSPLAQYPDPLQWSFIGAAPVPPDVLTPKEFYVPSGMSGGYVHQLVADRPLGDVVRSEVWVDYDANANPHNFAYDVRVAQVNPGPFWLEINGTEVSQGQTWYGDGWTPLNGPSTPPPREVSGLISIFLPTSRSNVSLLSPDGVSVNLSLSTADTPPPLWLPDAWHNSYPVVYSWELRLAALRGGYTWNAPVDWDPVGHPSTSPIPALQLTDETTGESVSFGASGGDISLDLLRLV